MSFIKLLSIDINKKSMISLVGAGGKTTTMFEVAKEMKNLGKKVLVTTTTKIFFPSKNQYDTIIISEDYDEIISKVKNYSDRFITVVCSGNFSTNADENGTPKKLRGIDKSYIDRLYSEDFFDVILVEADGAKGKLVKAPDVFEPVIPLKTTLVVGIIGFRCLGQPIDEEWVHRPKLFAEATKTSVDEKIDCESLVNLITAPVGLFKNAPKNSKCIVLLNTSVDLREQAEIVAKLVVEKKMSSNGLVKIDDVVVNTI